MNNEISVIRRRFDEGDIQVANMLPGAIRESWLRCANQSINMSSKLEYSHVRPDILAQLKNENEELLTVSNRHIEQLYRAVAGAGWSVLLTDTQCNALQVRQANRLKPAVKVLCSHNLPLAKKLYVRCRLARPRFTPGAHAGCSSDSAR